MASWDVFHPVYVLYVLHVSRAGNEPARYESPAITPNQITEFVWTFREFVRQDARHDLLIGSTDGKGLLVLDRHGLLYAYGALEPYTHVPGRIWG